MHSERDWCTGMQTSMLESHQPHRVPPSQNNPPGALTWLCCIPEQGGNERRSLLLGQHQASEHDGKDDLALVLVKEAVREAWRPHGGQQAVGFDGLRWPCGL